MTTKPLLLWVDLETTGTNAEADPILEIACILTDGAYPFAELGRVEAVVNPSESHRNWTHRLDEVVLRMHLENGLLAAVLSDAAKDNTLKMVEANIVAWLSEHGKPHEFVLAGSGVGHFDRRFIEEQMPKLSKYLRYYTLDVGVVRRFLLASGLAAVVQQAEQDGLIGSSKAHRAGADIEAHLTEARLYAKFLGGHLPS